MEVDTCNSSMKELKAGGSGVQGHLRLHSVVDTSLDYKRLGVEGEQWLIKMAQQFKALATKPDNLSSSSGTHVIQGEN